MLKKYNTINTYVDKTVKIHRQASNLGNIKGLPKGSGHGGYTIDQSSKVSSPEKLRKLYSAGNIVLIKDKDNSNYILKDFLAGDKIQAGHICPHKIKTAQNNLSDINLSDLISSIDILHINDVKIDNVFDSEDACVDNILMSNERVKYESLSRFDEAVNQIYNNIK